LHFKNYYKRWKNDIAWNVETHLQGEGTKNSAVINAGRLTSTNKTPTRPISCATSIIFCAKTDESCHNLIRVVKQPFRRENCLMRDLNFRILQTNSEHNRARYIAFVMSKAIYNWKTG
jgi:hypothetical protein